MDSEELAICPSIFVSSSRSLPSNDVDNCAIANILEFQFEELEVETNNKSV